MITYEKFWNLCSERRETTYTLDRKHHVPPATLQRLRKDEPISTKTIDRLCEILACQPGDIMEYKTEEEIMKEKFDIDYTIGGKTYLFNGEGEFIAGGDYAARVMIDGRKGTAYYATAENFEYYCDDYHEDCIDWEKPYLVELDAEKGHSPYFTDTVYEANRADCIQSGE